MTEEVLQGGESGREAVRIGDTARRRPPCPWTLAVRELLEYLRGAGFTAAPRPHGLDERGREVLECLEGNSGPDGWAPVVADEGFQPQAKWVREGYLDELAARVTWSRTHRHLFA